MHTQMVNVLTAFVFLPDKQKTHDCLDWQSSICRVGLRFEAEVGRALGRLLNKGALKAFPKGNG